MQTKPGAIVRIVGRAISPGATAHFRDFHPHLAYGIRDWPFAMQSMPSQRYGERGMSDEVPGGDRRAHRARGLRQWSRELGLDLGLQATALGLAAGAIAAVTYGAMILLQTAIWGALPDSRWVVLPVMVAGGAAIGLTRLWPRARTSRSRSPRLAIPLPFIGEKRPGSHSGRYLRSPSAVRSDPRPVSSP